MPNLETELEPEEPGEGGQVDPISGLGLRNPVCDDPSEIRDRQTRLACEELGTPESSYPASNYGFDIFIDTGADAPTGNIVWGIVWLLNGVWLIIVFVLKLILELLGLAFGLNPFGNGETMSQITGAIGRVFSTITNPWLSTLVVMGGIWFAYKGLIRREVGASVSGTLAAIAMLIVGLWIVHAPFESVGRLANMSNQVALGTISAPRSGSASRPRGGFAEAMSETWSRLIEVPFAGLNFSDVRWALGPPPPEAVKKADEKFCDDVGALATFKSLARSGSDGAKEACGELARKRYGAPKRIIDLYLRSSPNSPARKAMWEYFDKEEDERYKAKVAAQGGDGVLTRLSMLGLFVLGLLGAMMLLAWLALRLFTQAAIGFVLLLGAPFALFLPLLGDSGRRAFKTWGVTLLGAIVAKVIYSAFLSIVLLGIAILGRAEGAGGFLLSSAFAWAVFLKRAELIKWMSIGDIEAGRPLSVASQIAALTVGRRVWKTASGTVRGVASRSRGAMSNGEAEGGQERQRTAKEKLNASARGVADGPNDDARWTNTEAGRKYRDPSRRKSKGPPDPAATTEGKAQPAPQPAKGKPGQTPRPGGEKPQELSQAERASGEKAQDPGEAERARYERSQELINRADGNATTEGVRGAGRDLTGPRGEKAELQESSMPASHLAHLVGIDPIEFEKLKGPEREEAEEAIDKARRRERTKAKSQVGRTPGKGGQRSKGGQKHRQEDSGTRRQRLLRHKKPEAGRPPPPPRRNVVRGG